MTNPKTVTKWINRREETIDLGGEWSDENKRALLELARHAVELAYVVEDFDNQKECEALKDCQKTISKIEGEL